jgi:amino acid transporter
VADETSSSSSTPAQGTMKPTLGLTGLTANAAALIAPGAFLWLTFEEQSAYGAPSAAAAMWLGMFTCLLLCLATAVSYGQLAKLYPGAGSSYFFAEQAFLSKKQAFRWARLNKFIVGWASHLYYWCYPGVMVGVTAIFIGYMAGILWPNTFNSTIASPPLMLMTCVIFAIVVSWIAYKGVSASTSVAVSINVICMIALVIYACMSIAHRRAVKEGDLDYNLVNGMASAYVQDSYTPAGSTTSTSKTYSDGSPVWVYYVADKDGSVVEPNYASANNLANGAHIIRVNPTGKGYTVDDTLTPNQIPTDNNGVPVDPHWKLDAASGNLIVTGGAATQPAPATQPTLGWSGTGWAVGTVAKPQWNTTSYEGGMTQDPKSSVWTFNYHNSALSVISAHKFSFVIVQMGMAILCFCGFESCSALGAEAKNPKKHIPIAIVLSLLIQGGFCYLFEYFSANYFQSSSYTNTTAAGSSAPIGDMMQLVGAWAFGSPNAGHYFMCAEAVTVFLALIGTTLACINTGARVTYAMGKDEEVPAHFGLIHGKNDTPHRCIWTLCVISIAVSFFVVLFYLCGPSATFPDTTLTDAQKASFWYKLAFTTSEEAAKFPNAFIFFSLVSNFGMFMLYMLTCICVLVAYHDRPDRNILLHTLIPLFGMLANFLGMLFYLLGPLPAFGVSGMRWQEPYIALGIAALWGIYGAIYFMMRSKKLGRTIFVSKPPEASTA